MKLSTSDNNKGTIAYEIYRDGKIVGFDRTGTYKDNVDSSKTYRYEVIAYDYRANESMKSDIYDMSLKPVLNIPKSISIKVGQKIDINGEYSANDSEDGDITSKVKVTGNVI